MARSPGFTLMALLVLAIGIGVNVAAFSVFDMVALRPLPVPDADRLVRLERRSPNDYTSEMAYPSFLFYRDHAKTLAAAIAVLGVPPMHIDDDIQGVSTAFVTPNYFTQLGTRAALGRMLNPAVDGTIGDPPVMVIGYGLAGPMWLARRAPRPTLLILTIACGNLGALLLARAVQREREIGIRRAVGASGARVFRQLCTESLLLATLGAVAGLALGCAVTRIALTVLDAPKWLSAVPDGRILLFTLGMSFAAAVLFGFTPALQIARQRRHKTLARQILLSAQFAGGCVLLIVAGLLVRAAQHTVYTNPGFGYERLISIDGQLRQHGYTAPQAKGYLDAMRSRLGAIPGVRSVSLALLPPLGHTVSYATAVINDHNVRVYPNWVAPDFFATMQIPILLGRTFYQNEKHAMIVSRSFAREQWPGQNPLGQLVGDGKQKDVVVGVVADAHMNALNDDDALEEYWPAADEQMTGMVVIARSDGAVGNLSAAVKSISESLDPKLFPEIRSIKALYSESVVQIERIAGQSLCWGWLQSAWLAWVSSGW